ncbi:MAG: endolytic transglycosylase MltG [Mycobacterium sp.]|nr:endolytic transglycosylase MltG [Mycobacterium sp.]
MSAHKGQAGNDVHLWMPVLAMATWVFIVTIAVGWSFILESDAIAQSAGGGRSDVLVEVRAGDSVSTLGQRLADLGVVESSEAFGGAAQRSDGDRRFEPGFYALHQAEGAGEALEHLAAAEDRFGVVVVEPGARLDDAVDTSRGTVVEEGLLTAISRGSCAPRNGVKQCVPVDALRSAAADGTAVELGVPPWAAGPVTEMTGDHRRLEGLIAAGRWTFNPAASPQEILASLIAESAKRYGHNALLETAAHEMGITPYQMLTVASVLQLEEAPPNYSRAALDIYDELRGGAPTNFPEGPVCVAGDLAIVVAQHP